MWFIFKIIKSALKWFFYFYGTIVMMLTILIKNFFPLFNFFWIWKFYVMLILISYVILMFLYRRLKKL